jgi:signal transduction histidine kinase
LKLLDEFRIEVLTLEKLSQQELNELRNDQMKTAFSARVSLIVITLVSLGLLVIVARLFIAEAVHQDRLRSTAEQEAKELEKLVEERTRELSALSTHLQEFAEKEKSELAHNLHDELGGLLTAAKMDLSWIQSRVDQPAVQQRLQQLGSVLDEAMGVKRRVVEDLRPSLLDHFGLPTALRAYIESVCSKAGLKSEITVTEEDSVPKDIAITLFRVVQEGLTNAVRHAQASTIRLDLTIHGGSYSLRLTDDGKGINFQDRHFRWSHGLTGMRHRVKALGGRFGIDSAPGKGTTLRVEVPKRAA